MPQNAPTLIERGHNFLIIATNAGSYLGDGPIVSTQILYQHANSQWMSEQGKSQTNHSKLLSKNIPLSQQVISYLQYVALVLCFQDSSNCNKLPRGQHVGSIQTGRMNE